MKRSLALVLTLVLSILCARADVLDDQYVRIYNLIQEADLLNSNGQVNQSLSKYLEAQNALQKFHRINPDWNPKVVNFRLTYLNTKVAAASAQPISADKSAKTATASSTNAANSAFSGQLEHQLNSLKDQVHQLQSEKIILESKLKESFSAQPAAIDPHELTKSQDQVKSLQKENDLLKVTVGQQKVRLATTYDAKAFEQTKQALSEANRKLAEQTDKANTLAQEKTALQNKVNTMVPSEWNAAALEATKKALEDANRQLADQRQLSTKLASEKESLQSRLKGMNVDNETLAALKAENEVLKKQVTDLRSGQSDAITKLAQAQAEIASLRSDKEVLRLEKVTLESRVKQLLAAPAVAANPTPAENKQDAAKIKQLQQEKDDLQQKLDVANKELASRNKKGDSSRVLEMENQIAALRARLEVFEARQVPYTPEELALFKRPEINLTEATVKSAKKSVKDLPPGSAALVVQAQRDFAAHDMDKAEAKYLQVLSQDEKNGAVLANLAAIQLEMNRLDEAEKHIRQALAGDPDDAYSLSILGYLKFRQEKYDDALDALSRAAKLDPQNAQIQNYLGITLGQKGMRGAAETALRKAIQLEPNHASAHHNLAVIYLTQKPPLVELAKWHYQKALANGHPRNSDLEKMLDDQKIAANKL
jgi:Tfp pilus assembly protein PilF